MLRKVVTKGTASPEMKAKGLEFTTDIYTVGKTGTSKDSKNLWFIGIVPDKNITTGAWIGQESCIDNPKLNESCKEDEKLTNSSLAVGLWIKYMKKVLRFE